VSKRGERSEFGSRPSFDFRISLDTTAVSPETELHSTWKGDIMKKGYWVVTYRSISDEAAANAYGALAVPVVESFGGRFLTKSSSQVQAHEAGLQQRVVLVEFDSYEIALAARQSESYQKALQALGSGAVRDFRIVEGA
jgi:uncharacterized protein (DUF1330 family)